MSDTYKKVMLMRQVRSAIREVEATKDRMDIVTSLLIGAGLDEAYSGLNTPVDLLGIDCSDKSDDTEDFFLALQKLLEKLLKQLEEEQFTAQELRNLGREVDV